MNHFALCLYEINKKFTLGPQKFLLFKGKDEFCFSAKVLPVRGVGYGYYFQYGNRKSCG